MIWSKPPRTVELFTQQMQTAGQLKSTRLAHVLLAAHDQDIEPVRYFRIPPDAPKELGRLVTSFATLNSLGRLQHPGRGIYGIRTRAVEEADAYYYADDTVTLFEEANAIAERRAQTLGIFTPAARRSSELFAARLVPTNFQGRYAEERIDFLHVLTDDVERSNDHDLRPNRQLVLDELQLAIESLTAG